MVTEQLTVKSGYKQTDIGVIPKEWKVKPLNKTGDFSNGVNKQKEDYGHGCLHVNIDNIFESFSIIPANLGRVNVTKKEIKTYALQKGDICILRSSVKPDGVGYPILFEGNNFPVVFSGFIIRFRPNSEWDSIYLTFLLRSKFMRKIVISKSTVSANTNINQKALGSILIPIPPFTEQEKIILILLNINNLIKQLDYLIKKKKNIKQGAIQELLTGKRRLDEFTDDWNIKELGVCLTKKPEYGINASGVKYSYNLPTYVRITDISENGEFVHKNKVSVNHDNADQFILEKGDIVFARTGASTGKTYLYDTKDGKLVFAGFLIKIKTDPTILLPEYLKKFTETSAYWNWVKKTSMRSGQPGINADEYSKLLIPIPHPKEQYVISKILGDMDLEIKELETKRDKYIMIKNGMMQKLLTGEIRLT